MTNSENIMVLAPHPDDEVLGCGGTIKKLTLQGKNVFVLIASRGKPGVYSEERVLNVRKEAVSAHKMLGVRDTIFFDFPAPELDTVSVSVLAKAISTEINKLNIDTLFLPHRGDIHQDHHVLHNAGLVAARPLPDAPVKLVLAYETMSETEWAYPSGGEVFIPTLFVNISEVFPFKLEAMKCFRSQLREFPSSRSLKTLESLANLRGSTVSRTHAEAFMLIRTIED